MNDRQPSIPTGMDRMNGLLAWWGMPNVVDPSELEALTKRCHALVVELNHLFNDASSGQAQALSTANEEYARALQELLSVRQPAEFMSAQSRLVMGVMEHLAAQTGAWADLSQKLYDCCSAMVRESAEEAGKRTGQTVPVRTQSEAVPPAAKEATKRSTQG